jgi:phospholipid/cholesterol/gamma-HCH transport system substrate-binding protein
MNSEVKEGLVGALVFVGFVIALTYSYTAASFSTPSGYVISATFNHVDGLSNGDAVQIAGVPIGTVENMGLDENYKAVLMLRVNPGVAIPDDTSVAIHTNGLFGSKYVSLDPGGSEQNLKPGDHMAFTQDAVLVDELLELIIAQGKAARAKRNDTAAGGK